MIKRLFTIAFSLFPISPSAIAEEVPGFAQFTSNLRIAIAEKDEQKLEALIYFEGASPEDKQRMTSMSGSLLMNKKDVDDITLEPLPENFESVLIVRGKKIEPTAPPEGMVKVTFRGAGEGPMESTSAYTVVDGKFFLVGIKTTDLDWSGPPDKNLNYSIFGKGSSELQIQGVWNASGVQMKKTFKESNSTFWGQHFDELTVTSDSDDCDVTVTINEDGKEIFSERLKGKGVVQYIKKS